MDNVIYTYTDEQAQEDGILVPLSDLDRVTRTVFDRLLEGLGTAEAITRCQSWLTKYGAEARRIYDLNLEGGIWAGALTVSRTATTLLHLPAVLDHEQTVWIMPNELGGLTIMFPEDY